MSAGYRRAPDGGSSPSSRPPLKNVRTALFFVYNIGMDNETLKKVCVQRDCLANALGELVRSIRHGVLNNMLPDANLRDFKTEDDAKKKCPKGYDRREVLRRMGTCCIGCDVDSCECDHLSFEEERVFEAMERASDVLEKPDAEMPAISPDDFIRYEPDKYAYEATPEWIARTIHRLVVGYWILSDHGDKDLEARWERAFDDTLAICLGVYGKEYMMTLDAMRTLKTEEEGKEFLKEHPEVSEFIERVSERCEDERFYEAVRDKNACVHMKTTLLVDHAVMLRLEYRFGHRYPGADMGVYGDNFIALIDMCLSIAGMYMDEREMNFGGGKEGAMAEIEFRVEHKHKVCDFMRGEGGLNVIDIAKAKRKDG